MLYTQNSDIYSGPILYLNAVASTHEVVQLVGMVKAHPSHVRMHKNFELLRPCPPQHACMHTLMSLVGNVALFLCTLCTHVGLAEGILIIVQCHKFHKWQGLMVRNTYIQ